MVASNEGKKKRERGARKHVKELYKYRVTNVLVGERDPESPEKGAG